MGEEATKLDHEARIFTVEEEAQAQVDIYKYIFGFAEMAAVKCAIDMGIPDVLQNHQGPSPITLNQLSSTLNCSPSLLHRIMRFLIHRGIFKQQDNGYVQTPLSSLLTKHGEKSMAAFVMLETSPVMLAPWNKLHARVSMKGTSAFEDVHGEDVWKFAEKTPGHSQLINDAMACHAREAVPAIVEHCSEVFDGIKTLVDVGGGDGTSLRMLVKAFPWIHGINFDLPHVVSAADDDTTVDHVGGDMFRSVPKADATFLMWVLHDWGDDECINILKNCRKAIPQDTGKVIIAEAVIIGGSSSSSTQQEQEQEQEQNHNRNKVKVKVEDIGLMLDMVMMAHTTNGKERTFQEWIHILKAAGFTRYTFNNTHSVISIIQAYP